MRTSVDKDDPGFNNFAFRRWEIFLNGKPVRFCITADEEKGFVVVFATDENGKHIWNQTRDDLVRWKLYGKVEIKPRNDNPR